MNTPHTPGPWFADQYGVITGGTNNLTIVCEVPVGRWWNHQVLASSESTAKWCRERYDEAVSNSKLIASAPDLLDCCQRLLAIVEGGHGLPLAIADKTRALLAKIA